MFRDAIRGLRVARGSTLTALVLLTLTLGVGTATYSVVDGVALRPLPYAAPGQLMAVSLASSGLGSVRRPSPSEYFIWKEGNASLVGLGAARLTPAQRVDHEGTSEQVVARLVTHDLFNVLGVSASVGRLFDDTHSRVGGPEVAVLSHSLWRRRFHSDPAIVGRSFQIGDVSREIIGVLPETVVYPITAGAPPELYLPWVVTERDRDNVIAQSLSVVGRMREGVTIDQAQSDLSRLDSRTIVTDLHSDVVGNAGKWLMFVLAGVVFLLLVAWVNVANVLLARATTRISETATRTVLGASRRRLFGTSLLEGLILVAVSFLAGTVLAVFLVEIAQANLPSGLARASAIAVDGRVLLVSALGAGICALVFAAVPAWLTTRPDVSMLMKTSGGAVGGSRGQNRALNALLVGNVSCVCVLLVASTLVVYTFVHVSTKDLGFDRTNVAMISFERPLTAVPVQERAAAAAVVRAELMARAAAVAGVVDVAIASNGTGPLSGSSVRYSLSIPGVPELPFERENLLETNMVSPTYFSLMRMQLARGRLFDADDHAGAPAVMLINEAAAQKFFSGRDPIGQTVSLFGPATIVGALKSVHFDGPEGEERPAMYIPIDQMAYNERIPNVGTILVRTAGDPRWTASAVRDAIDPSPGMARNVEPTFLDDHFSRLTATRRFNAFVMGIFGLIAALIGAIGVFGTTTYFVAQQVPAIGIRMALGATPSRIRREVLKGALTRVALGITIGLTGAYAVSHLMEAFVFGIRAVSPAAYLAVAGLLIAVTAAAAMVPATRAARLDPLTALRSPRG